MSPSDGVCRACGHHLHAIPDVVLEGIGASVTPQCIAGLCVTCVEQIRVPADPNGYALRCVRAEDVDEFLTERLRILAERVSAGLPVDRCEVISGHWSGGALADVRCRRFANATHEGRKVCATCLSVIRRGRKRSFTREEATARTFTIFARTPEELVNHAMLYSREWAAA